MALLEETRGHKGHAELLIPVDGVGALNEGLPFGGVIDHVGDLDIVLPVFHILDDDLVGGVHGEGTGDVLGEGLGDAPGVYHVHLASGRVGVAQTEGRADDHAERLILVDEALGLAAVNGLKKILSRSQHAYPSLFAAGSASSQPRP
jgi:hypothetical protein